jgi:lysophospholipase L1-like esterase
MNLRVTPPKIVLVIFICSLFACGESAKLTPLSAGSTILAFGDSLTSGVGVAAEDSYPSVLARNLDLRIINAGLPGEVSADGKKRLGVLLNKINPDLVLICHGGNDFLHRLPLAETEINIREMVAQVKSRDIDVALIGVPKFGVWTRAPDLYERVANEFTVPLDENTLGELEADTAMKSDPVHLNELGYKKLAEAVEVLLVQAGAVAP